MSGSESEDWDAEIEAEGGAGALAGAQAESADLYTMQSSGGMVTITPAGKKAKFSKVPPVEVCVDWNYPDNEAVSVFTSYDDFDGATELEPYEDQDTGETYFTGMISLPPGRYLIRFLVDGEWRVDDNQDVVCSLGNEYNSLVVDDPTEGTDESDDDWDNYDEAEADDIRAQVFGGLSGVGFGSSILSNLDTSKGPVTITPEMAEAARKQEQDMTPEDREALAAAKDVSMATPGNVEWDSQRNAFVVRGQGRKSQGGDGEHKEYTQEELDAMDPAERKRIKNREARRRKKRRQKERRRKNKGRRAQQADIQAIKEEIVKREREWREAWIVHELKTQEIREKEKAAMREQFAAERETWGGKIKSYANEANGLRQQVNDLQKSLQEAQAGKGVSESATKRAREQYEEEHKRLKDELSAAQVEAKSTKEALAKAREEGAAAEQKGREDKAGLQKELDELRSAASSSKLALEAAQRELSDAKAEIDSEKKRSAETKASFEQQLESAKKDLELQSQQASQSAAAEKSQIEAALQTRIDELKGQLDEKSATVDTTKGELATANASVAEAKRTAADLQAQLDVLKAELEAAKKQQEEKGGEVASLAAKLAALSAERASLESTTTMKLGELSAAKGKLHDDLKSKQEELDKALGDLDVLKGKMEVSEASFQREKAEYERKLGSLSSSRQTLASSVGAVAAQAKGFRENLAGFKDAVNRDVAAMRSAIEDSKKFLVQGLRAQSGLLKDTMTKYKKEISERRKYFNLVQELRGNIRVFCRARPIIAEDHKKGSTDIAATFPEENTIKITSAKRTHQYEFDRVFGFDSTQDSVFAEISDLVTSCMDGYNVCIFAYGQTGSGKTFTMDGPVENRGVNFRALSELFALRDSRQGDYTYDISVSMLEIYNEKIKDLLDSTPARDTKKMKIHKGPNGMFVANLTDRAVKNEEDLLAVMEQGKGNRTTGVTNMNVHSSRSHMILSVRVVGRNLVAGRTYYGKMHLIDLAGSERVGRSGATGDRLKEAQAINKSLSALGNVIEALQKKTSHTPYRDSKLTHLLQDSLGGNAKTLMFINVSPVITDAEETFCSLNFAERVRRVELGSAVRTIVAPPTESKTSTTKTVKKKKPSAKK